MLVVFMGVNAMLCRLHYWKRTWQICCVGYDRAVITGGTVSAQANWAVPAIGVSARQEEAGSIQIERGTLDLKGALIGSFPLQRKRKWKK